MLLVVPTRGRPQAMLRQMDAIVSTCGGYVEPLYVVDEDDPSAVEYCRLGREGSRIAVLHERRRLVGSLNFAWEHEDEGYDWIGFMGDDHLPRTQGWDSAVVEGATGGPQVVYGNDLLQGPNLPTAVFLPVRLVRALGFMAPPCLLHFFADNFWLDLGNALGTLTYLPHVIIEHMHPVNGKGVQDATYADSGPLMDTDLRAWLEFKADGGFGAAVDRVRKEYGL